jgi:hypothetical protein
MLLETLVHGATGLTNVKRSSAGVDDAVYHGGHSCAGFAGGDVTERCAGQTVSQKFQVGTVELLRDKERVVHLLPLFKDRRTVLSAVLHHCIRAAGGFGDSALCKACT